MSPIFTMQNDEYTVDLLRWYQNGIAISKKDIGAPAVREVIYDLATQDGSDDQTRFLSQRVVSVTGKCFNIPGQSRSQAWRKMQPFLDPQARCLLTFQLDDDVIALQLQNLRVSQFTKAASSPTGFDFSIQWKCDPVAYDLNQQQVTLAAIGTAGAGRTYNLIPNRQYPPWYGATPIVITSNGTYKTWPIYRIYGPCTNPVVSIVDTTTQTVLGQFGLLLTIPGGQYVEVDSSARTVMLNGPSGSSRYNTLDFANTDWEPLQPGENTVVYEAASASQGSQCIVLWNDAYME